MVLSTTPEKEGKITVRKLPLAESTQEVLQVLLPPVKGGGTFTTQKTATTDKHLKTSLKKVFSHSQLE